MKKILSLLLVLAAALSINARTLYLDPGIWETAGAKYSIWNWGDGLDGSWSEIMTKNEAGYYETEVSDDATKAIFVRLSSSATEGNWDDKWNQTDDLDLGENNLFTITGWGEGKSTGEWSKYTTLPKPVLTYDTTMYVAGNFTDWAADMREFPYTVTLPADSALKFKQVRAVVTYADGVVKDTTLTWYGQANEGVYMTRENIGTGWLLDGKYDVLLTTDAEGDYTFDLVDGVFTVTFPEIHIPVLTYDTTMYVAGNFTNWIADMQEFPYTVTLPADSALKFKQVRAVVTYADGVVKDTTLTWYGQATEGYSMTRENVGEGWLLDGDFDVLLTTDVEGEYTFELVEGVFIVTFPENSITTMVDGLIMEMGAMKQLRGGNLYILREGKTYNAAGLLVK